MAKFPALPLWTDAYLADTTHLTRDEHGAYLLLLMASWRRGSCDLPDDDALLAKIVKCDMRTWPRLRSRMLEFFVIENGNWVQKRLKKERMYVDHLSNIRAEASRSRWLKQKETTDANALQSSCKTHAPIPLVKSLIVPSESNVQTPESDIDIVHSKSVNWVNGVSKFRDFWLLYPKHVSKAAAIKAYEVAVRKVEDETILAGVKRYASWIKRNAVPPQFVKMPSTWLNQGCWDDELEDNEVGQMLDAKTQLLAEYDDMVARTAENYQTPSRGNGSFSQSKVVHIRGGSRTLFGQDGEGNVARSST